MVGLLCTVRLPLVTLSTEGAWIHIAIFLQGCTGGKGMCSTHVFGVIQPIDLRALEKQDKL